MGKVAVLKAGTFSDTTLAELDMAFELVPMGASPSNLPREIAARIRGIAVRKTVLDQAALDHFPALEIVSSYSAGTENIDTLHARVRGIEVSNSSHALAEEVANFALGQMLALTRDSIAAHAHVRDGHWPQGAFPLRRSLIGMKVGIVGLGHIGRTLAGRLDAVGAQTAYSGPNRKPGDRPYFSDPMALAAWAEMLVLTCPLTPQTKGLVGAEMLDALGRQGLLVNVSRGNILDEAALIRALAKNRIAGAALDVFATEPEVPLALRQDPRLILSPHVGSGTHQTRQRMGDTMVDALARKLGAPLPRRSMAQSISVLT